MVPNCPTKKVSHIVFGIHLIIGHSRIDNITSVVRTGAGEDIIGRM